MRHAIISMIILLIATPLGAQTQESVRRADESISAADLARHLSVIAHDSMLGRDTPSPELEMTANYLAGQFQALGLSPLGDAGSYLQRYTIRMTNFDLEHSAIRLNGQELEIGRDVRVAFPNDPDAVIRGETVVVRGSAAAGVPETSVTGKIVVFVQPSPSGALFPELFQNLPAIGPQGPAAVLVISDRSGSAFADGFATFEQELPQPTWDAAQRFAFPVLETRREVVEDVLGSTGFDLNRAFEESSEPMTVTTLPELDLQIDLPRVVSRRASAPNVVAVIEGSDPELADEFVVVSAHIDHEGLASSAVDGDSVYNGADDDGSGTVALLEIAEALKTLDSGPRRSIVFLGVSGEEKGLWGSDYFTAHPTIDLSKTVVNLNLDMIGRNWRDTIVVIGQDHSDLGVLLRDVTGRHPEFGLEPIADPWPDQRLYFRSDHFNFARRGVPILFFTNGVHEDYHAVTDEPDRIDTEKTARVARLVFHMALAVANIPDRPKWRPESFELIVETDGQ